MHASSLGGNSLSSAGSASAASGASLASSLALLAGHDTQHKIKELLPSDTSARSELLLSLLKSSYSSSLHSADVRMAALTQELVAARAQLAYGESKLRSVEALAEEAGRAAEEQKKRAEMLQQENVRFRAENQALKAENAQLAHFKTLLLSAANGMAPPPQAAALALSLAAPYPNAQALYATTSNAADANSHLQQPPSTIAADAEWNRQAAASQQQQQQHTQYFFSPVKSARLHESISLSSVPTPLPQQQQQQQQQAQSYHPSSASQSTPQPAPRSKSNYLHVMPSPLSADALASPSPQRHNQPSNGGGEHRNAAAAAAGAPDILHEINAHLSSSRGGRSASPATSPVAARSTSAYHHSNGFTTAVAPAASSASGLVDQARALFHTAQSRLPAHTFTEFVALVQQFRSAASNGGNWDGIRQRAAGLLAPWQDIHALFEQLLHATQVQQQQQQQQQR